MRAFGVVGGGAVLAFTAGLGGLALLTPLTGLAGVGALGNIKLKNQLSNMLLVICPGLLGLGDGAALCMGPLFCRTQGEWCLIVTTSNGLVCPTFC